MDLNLHYSRGLYGEPIFYDPNVPSNVLAQMRLRPAQTIPGAEPMPGEAAATTPTATPVAMPGMQTSAANAKGYVDNTLKLWNALQRFGRNLPATPTAQAAPGSRVAQAAQAAGMVQLPDGSWTSKQFQSPLPGSSVVPGSVPAPTSGPLPGSYGASVLAERPKADPELLRAYSGSASGGGVGSYSTLGRNRYTVAPDPEAERAQLELDILREQLAQEQIKTQGMSSALPPSEEVGMVRASGDAGNTSYVSGAGDMYGTRGEAQRANQAAGQQWLARQPESITAAGNRAVQADKDAAAAERDKFRRQQAIDLKQMEIDAAKEAAGNKPDRNTQDMEYSRWQTAVDGARASLKAYNEALDSAAPKAGEEIGARNDERTKAWETARNTRTALVQELETLRTVMPGAPVPTDLMTAYAELTMGSSIQDRRLSAGVRAQLIKGAWEEGPEKAKKLAELIANQGKR